AANRDEFHDRPTAPAGPWPDHPGILGGRDLQSGGSWLGVTRGGRWAAVTNVREGLEPRPEALSRGHLVADFLKGGSDPLDFAEALQSRLDEYNGFNRLLGVADELCWISNRSDLRPSEHGGG